MNEGRYGRDKTGFSPSPVAAIPRLALAYGVAEDAVDQEGRNSADPGRISSVARRGLANREEEVDIWQGLVMDRREAGLRVSSPRHQSGKLPVTSALNLPAIYIRRPTRTSPVRSNSRPRSRTRCHPAVPMAAHLGPSVHVAQRVQAGPTSQISQHTASARIDVLVPSLLVHSDTLPNITSRYIPFCPPKCYSDLVDSRSTCVSTYSFRRSSFML